MPAAVAVVVYPSLKLLADKFLLASQPAKADAVAVVVTEVTPVPPKVTGTVPNALTVAVQFAAVVGVATKAVKTP